MLTKKQKQNEILHALRNRALCAEHLDRARSEVTGRDSIYG